MSTIVKTQGELDAAVAASAKDIVIASPAGVWLSVRGSAEVRAYDSAAVSAYDSAAVSAYESAAVTAYDSAAVSAYDSAVVTAYGSAVVRAYDSAVVRAYGSAVVRAYDSAVVRAYGSAVVRAYGSAVVTASAHVAVRLQSPHAIASGGVIIDMSNINLTDAASWCEHHGVKVVDGVATVFKAVDGSWTTDRGTDYSPGSLPDALDWRDDHERGGGLHFSPWPWQALEYHPEATRFIAAGVSIETLRPLMGGIPQCKAPRVVVACREVTINGDEVTA